MTFTSILFEKKRDDVSVKSIDGLRCRESPGDAPLISYYINVSIQLSLLIWDSLRKHKINPPFQASPILPLTTTLSLYVVKKRLVDLNVKWSYSPCIEIIDHWQ